MHRQSKPHIHVATATMFIFGIFYSQGFADGPNILPAGNFENVQATYVPWAGVDANGNLHGLEGAQLAVSDEGNIVRSSFGPSVAVGDLNGDGKQDLVVADSRGFFWFYPNSGTPEKPIFTQGEIIPIWLGEEAVAWDTEGVDNVVPRIQLLDLQGNKKLDLLAGTYSGKLFRIPNLGSTEVPLFKPTKFRDSLLINTRREGRLWCNYLAPFFSSAFNSQNTFDLIMGEGTYSANSIYLLRNTGSNDQPSFDEDHIQKIIPGMGLEQLIPAVVDWNNDGKPDVICGDRTGFINLFINNSSDSSNPTFASAIHLKVGGEEKFGNSVTVTVCDLSNNHLPNLVIGKADGTLLYAINTGKVGAPDFSLPASPIKGTLPPEYHYLAPTQWYKGGAWGVPYEMVACVNPQVQPDFTFADGDKSKNALKFSVWPYPSQIFKERYYMPEETETNQHTIVCANLMTVALNKRYRVHFWVKGEGVNNFCYRIVAAPHGLETQFQPASVQKPIDAGSTWSEINDSFRIDNSDAPSITTWSYSFAFRFMGQGTFYISGLTIQPAD